MGPLVCLEGAVEAAAAVLSAAAVAPMRGLHPQCSNMTRIQETASTYTEREFGDTQTEKGAQPDLS